MLAQSCFAGPDDGLTARHRPDSANGLIALGSLEQLARVPARMAAKPRSSRNMGTGAKRWEVVASASTAPGCTGGGVGTGTGWTGGSSGEAAMETGVANTRLAATIVKTTKPPTSRPRTECLDLILNQLAEWLCFLVPILPQGASRCHEAGVTNPLGHFVPGCVSLSIVGLLLISASVVYRYHKICQINHIKESWGMARSGGEA